MFATVGMAVFLTQYLQSVLGLSPFKAALWSLVPAAGVAVMAPIGAALAQRVDRAHVMGGGFLLSACGFLWLSQVRRRLGHLVHPRRRLLSTRAAWSPPWPVVQDEGQFRLQIHVRSLEGHREDARIRVHGPAVLPVVCGPDADVVEGFAVLGAERTYDGRRDHRNILQL
ncbi:hypothetical protein SALBM135S_06228 [Streptomyces alboniger]